MISNLIFDSLALLKFFKEFSCEDGAPRYQCWYCGGHLMELHSTSKHLSSVSHRNKVAKYEQKWGKNAPSLGFSQENTSRNINLVENHAPSNPEYAMMDTDTVSGHYQEYIPSFIPSGTDVGFRNQMDDDIIGAAPLDWEDFLYQRLHVDPVLDGNIGNNKFLLDRTKHSSLWWHPFYNEEVCLPLLE